MADPLAPPPLPPVQRLNRGVLLVAAAIALLTLAVAFLATPRPAPRPQPTARPLAAGSPAFLERAPSPLPAPRPTPTEEDYLRALLDRVGRAPAGPGAPAGGGLPAGATGFPAGTVSGNAVPGSAASGTAGAQSFPPGFPAAAGFTGPDTGLRSTAATATFSATTAASRLDLRRQAFERALRAPLAEPVSSPTAERGLPPPPFAWPQLTGFSTPSPATPAGPTTTSATSPAATPPALATSSTTTSPAAAPSTSVPSSASVTSPTSATSTVTPFPAPTLPAGTLIPALLLTAVDSDLPGPLLAQVSRDVYDPAGTAVAVPRGSRLLGRYDNQVAVGQRRLLVAWTRLQLPDGTAFDLPGLPGTDPAGAAGLPARVESHAIHLFGDALLLSLLAAGADLSQPASRSLTLAPSAGSVASAAVGQELASVGIQLLRRDLSRQPTLRLPSGTPFAVFVNGDLQLTRPAAPRPAADRRP